MTITVSPKDLFLAIDARDKQAVIDILDHGADPDSADSKSFPPPLIQAVLAGDADIVDILLAYGAKLDTLDPVLAATPLFCAAALGHDRIARTLLVAGADPNTPDLLGNPPLLAAAAGNHWPIAQSLIDHACDPFGRNPYGATAADIDLAELSDLLDEELPPPLTTPLARRAGLACIAASIERVETQATVFRRPPASGRTARAEQAGTTPLRPLPSVPS